MLTDEQIAFLIKMTGWSLEYIRTIPIKELIALINELSYQEQLNQYRQQVGFASIMATMISLWSKNQISPTDLVGQPPLRAGQVRKESSIWILAQQAGIRIPRDIS